MSHDRHRQHLDLAAVAYESAKEHGFEPDFSPAAVREVQAMEQRPPLDATKADGARDLRQLVWSSIDNDESRDLDQIEVAEHLPDGRSKLRVGIADVDSLVARSSAVDAHAAGNTTSLYTGVRVFPMLPEALSTGLTSLNQDEDRLAIVIEMTLSADGAVESSDVYRAIVRNHAKLAYDETAAWLDGTIPVPAHVTRVPGLEAQLRHQDQLAHQLKARRHEQGALDLETIEPSSVMKDGDVVSLDLTKKGRSRDLIEDFMVAANGVMARFLDAQGRSAIRRIVRKPKRWDRIVELAATYGTKLPAIAEPRALSDFLAAQRQRDPKRFPDLSLAVVKLLGPGEYALEQPGRHTGHFGLATQDYTHSTAPNRRFADLVTQRLLKAVLAGAPSPYDDDALAQIASHCTSKENDSRAVERFMRKVTAALFLSSRIGDVFDAIVTGVTADKGTFVRLITPPAEGRVVRGEQGLDVGDTLRVRLVATTPSKGFIDFARA